MSTSKSPVRINEMVVSRIQQRLDLGAEKYGDTISVDDRRDFVEESLEEALDMAVYLSGALIQLQHYRHANKKNTISTNDMSLLLEGLGMIVLKGKDDKDYDKVNHCQQLIDRLTEYAQEKFETNQKEMSNGV